MASEQESTKLPERRRPELSEHEQTDYGSQEAANKRFEAAVDKRAAKLAKEMSGHVHFIRDGAENPLIAAANKVFQKAARRTIN